MSGTLCRHQLSDLMIEFLHCSLSPRNTLLVAPQWQEGTHTGYPGDRLAGGIPSATPDRSHTATDSGSDPPHPGLSAARTVLETQW